MSNSEKFEKIEIHVFQEDGKEVKYTYQNNKDAYDSFAKFIQAERRKRKISQTQLGKMCGLTGPSYISSIELGKTNPSEKIMIRLAKVLGLKLLFTSTPDE